MKKLLFLLIAVLLPVTASAQLTVVQTTLSNTMNDSQNTMVVASASCTICGGTIAVGNEVFLDREALIVTAVNSTTLTVKRGQDGTSAAAHTSGILVFVAPTQYFARGFESTGRCTAVNELALPKINTSTGTIQYCINSRWTGQSLTASEINNKAYTPVVNTAYTVTQYDYIVAMTSLSTVRTITLPSAAPSGKTIIIQDESGLASTSNTITISGPTNASTITAAYGSKVCRGNGAAWFCF